jgi:putative spermidine/putrescine transport system ATP-binding protein
VIGRPGLFSIRPEKIRIDGELSEPAAAGDTSATGTVTDVVYAGATVRYAVALDAGGQLSVVRQNLDGGAEFKDGRVRLSWRHEHSFQVPGQ